MNVMADRFVSSSVFDHEEFHDHETVAFCRDAASGLSAIIAVHDTRLGPAIGGCRMWPYATPHDALTDALRLSRGMTYKNALAGLDNGGGKAVIIADPKTDKTPALLRAFGAHVDRLGGVYRTAEDVGITAEDMEVVGTVTEFALGTEKTGLGDPSPYTALGVFSGIRAALRHRFATDALSGLTVCVKGLGNVGYRLCGHLHAAGARLIVSDVFAPAVDRAVAAFGAAMIAPDDAHAADCDVFAPCALGGGLNQHTIPDIRAGIVAGAANNQLAADADGERLTARGILYAPDYVINAGGVISIALADPNTSAAAMRNRVSTIGDTLAEIFARADATASPTNRIADSIAEERLNAAGGTPATET